MKNTGKIWNRTGLVARCARDSPPAFLRRSNGSGPLQCYSTRWPTRIRSKEPDAKHERRLMLKRTMLLATFALMAHSLIATASDDHIPGVAAALRDAPGATLLLAAKPSAPAPAAVPPPPADQEEYQVRKKMGRIAQLCILAIIVVAIVGKVKSMKNKGA